jgi:hypothetical protein
MPKTGLAVQHEASGVPLSLLMAIIPETQFASQTWIGVMLLVTVLSLARLTWGAFEA